MLLEAVCGCDVEVPIEVVPEPSPRPGLFVRLRAVPAAGLTPDEAYRQASEIVATVCDACVEP